MMTEDDDEDSKVLVMVTAGGEGKTQTFNQGFKFTINVVIIFPSSIIRSLVILLCYYS